MLGNLLGRGVGGRGAGTGPLGIPTSAPPNANVAVQGVSAKRTASGSEASYTDTTIDFPASVKPTTVQVGVSAGMCLVKVSTAGQRLASGQAVYGQPYTMSLGLLPRGTSIIVSTEAGGAADIGITAGYSD